MRTGKPRIWRSRSSRILSRPTWMRGRQVGELVDAEDAAIGARHDAEMHHLRIGQRQAPGRCLDRIDVAEQIGDRDIRRRQFLVITLLTREPVDGGVVALLFDHAQARHRDRCQRVVIQLRATDHGNGVIEELGDRTQKAGLRLAAQAEKDHVVTGEHGVDEAGDDRAVVAQNAGKKALAAAQSRDQVGANLLAYRAWLVAAFLQGA